MSGFTKPDPVDSTSMSTLSVETVNSISPFCTCSPGCFSHAFTDPSVMVRPSCGITISDGMAFVSGRNQFPNLISDFGCSGEHLILQHWAERIRGMQGANSPGRGVHTVERLLASQRDHLR